MAMMDLEQLETNAQLFRDQISEIAPPGIGVAVVLFTTNSEDGGEWVTWAGNIDQDTFLGVVRQMLKASDAHESSGEIE